MSEEISFNFQCQVKMEPLDEVNYGQSIFLEPEPTDDTNADVTIKLETEDLHHSIDIKEEILEPQVNDEDETKQCEREASLTDHNSESNDSDTDFLHRKRKIRDDDPAKKYYEYKLQKLYQRIEHQQLLFDLQQQIHQKTLERLKIDLQHKNEILKMDEKIQKAANKIKILKRLNNK